MGKASKQIIVYDGTAIVRRANRDGQHGPPLLSMHYSANITSIEEHVRDLYQKRFPSWRHFHNIYHTSEVVKHCRLLAGCYSLKEPEMFTLLTAAWFHDTGYCADIHHHEEASVKIARAYLDRFDFQQNDLAAIEKLILATRQPVDPSTLSEKILCDSDLHHLASPDYEAWSALLQTELEAQYVADIPDEQWNRENIAFFRTHHYFTEYACTMWEEQKQKNLSRLVSLQESLSSG